MVLKKLGQPIMTNLYYNTVKSLLERASSVLVDAEAVEVLLGYIIELLQGESPGGDLNVEPSRGSLKGLNLLQVTALNLNIDNHLRELTNAWFFAAFGSNATAHVHA